MSDWSTDFGPIYVFSDAGRFLKWRSKFATWRRTLRWFLLIVKQATCMHRQWVFNAEGYVQLSLQDAKRWYPSTRLEGKLIRTNFSCLRCGKWSHRFRPDLDAEICRLRESSI